MNNNIKDTTSLVFVKGKNLFDGVFRQGLHVSYSTANRITNLNSIKSIAGQRYTFSANLPSGYQIKIMNCSSNDINATVLNDTDYTTSSVTVYCGSNGYLKVIVKKTNDENITPIEVSNYNFQIEQNSTATTYEPYVEKEILVKNNNGTFDRFLAESDIPDVDTSKWTQTLLGYRYTNGNNVVYAGTVVTSFSSGSVNFDITNLGLAERPDTVQLTANSLRYPLRYDYDSSTATRLKIEVINNGSVYSHTGNVRFSMTVYGKLA